MLQTAECNPSPPPPISGKRVSADKGEVLEKVKPIMENRNNRVSMSTRMRALQNGCYKRAWPQLEKQSGGEQQRAHSPDSLHRRNHELSTRHPSHLLTLLFLRTRYCNTQILALAKTLPLKLLDNLPLIQHFCVT